MTHSNMHTRQPRSSLIGFLFFVMIAGQVPWLFGAELFPYAPPSPSPRRSVESPSARPQLSSEDRTRISRIVAHAKRLNHQDKNELRSDIQKNLAESAAKGNLKHVQYFTELLQQID